MTRRATAREPAIPSSHVDAFNACVSIRFDLTSGDHGYATGFFVGENAIITARHAFEGEDIVAGSHRVGMPPQGLVSNATSLRLKPKPLWKPEGEHACDLIVLQTTKPVDVAPIDCDFQAPIPAGTKWDSRGFPAARDGTEKSARSGGSKSKAVAGANDPWLDIGGELAARRARDGSVLRAMVLNAPRRAAAAVFRPFGGFSGGPILVDGRAVGVIVSGDAKQDDRELVAVSFKALASDVAFLKAIGRARADAPRDMKGLYERLCGRFSSEVIKEALGGLVGASTSDGSLGPLDQLRVLLGVDALAVLDRAAQSFVDCRPRARGRSDRRRTVACCMRAISFELLPDMLALSPGHSIHSSTAAEAAAARASRRGIEVRHDRKKSELAFPFRAPVPAETGVQSPEACLRGLIANLCRKLGMRPKDDAHSTLQSLRARLRGLRRVSDPDRRPLYAVVEGTLGAGSKGESLVARVIREHIPELLCIEVANGRSGRESEYHADIEDSILRLVAE